MEEIFAYLKQNGPWAVQWGIAVYLLVRAGKWFAKEVAEPLVKALVAAIPTVANAAVKMHDDLATVKDGVARLEQSIKDARCRAAEGR